MRRSITLLTRLPAFAVLIVALTLAPSAFLSGADLAEAKTKKECDDRLHGCQNRCAQRAAEKYPKDGDKQMMENANCGIRTCNAQHKACVATASDGKKQPLTQQKVTRSPSAAPTQPLTPQKVTRSPRTAPTQPLTSSPTLPKGNR